MRHLGASELEAGLASIRRSPTTAGQLEMIVCRPSTDEREIIEEGFLDVALGLVGDSWSRRPSTSTPDGSPNPDGQLTLINARFARLIAGDRQRAALVGDQLHVDYDIGVANLPVGARVRIGEAMVEISPKLHTGCDKFSTRFGLEALRIARSPAGQALRLRGVYARVITSGTVRLGDTVVAQSSELVDL